MITKKWLRIIWNGMILIFYCFSCLRFWTFPFPVMMMMVMMMPMTVKRWGRGFSSPSTWHFTMSPCPWMSRIALLTLSAWVAVMAVVMYMTARVVMTTTFRITPSSCPTTPSTSAQMPAILGGSVLLLLLGWRSSSWGTSSSTRGGWCD